EEETAADGSVLALGDLVVYATARTAQRAGEPVAPTAEGFDLPASSRMRHPRQAPSGAQIPGEVGSGAYGSEGNPVEVRVHGPRARTDEGRAPMTPMIRPGRGAGRVLRAAGAGT
ncbi:DNA-binding response regulator, partial [Streptomyces sp. TRM76130]|nr:DNA-binding response regulator [Streptomyces sp. TRM76130]